MSSYQLYYPEWMYVYWLCMSPPLNISPDHIGCMTHVWSIKYRLFTKQNAQIETNL